MKTDISRLPFNEWKHSLGVFLQMGRVQLDADWNEQAEIGLRLLQRLAGDTVETGSPNHGFRVDNRILLEAMDSVRGWTAEIANVGDPAPHLFIDYFDYVVGEGSLSLSGAVVLARQLASPADFSQWREIVFAAKGSFLTAEVTFYLDQGGTRGKLTTTEDANPINGWRIFRADPTTANPAIDATKVDGYGFLALNPARKYQIDSIKVDRPIRQPLVAFRAPTDFAATANPGDTPVVAITDDDRLQRNLAVEVTKATGVGYNLPVLTDLSHARRLIVAAKIVGGGAPAITVQITDAAAAQVNLAGATVTAAGQWQISAFALPQGAIDWTNVKTIAWNGLTPANTYHIGPVWAEMSLTGNLAIMGGDGSSEHAGRFYGNGLAAIKEDAETYFSQRDLPAANPLPLVAPADGNTRIDLAYLDLWERPLTYIEDPQIREIALDGPDTCTRTKLIAQVRLLKGTEVAAGSQASPPNADFRALPQFGGGVLSTKNAPGAPASACTDPCEPIVSGSFTGTDNRLYRVEVHSFGQVGAAADPNTAQFKWSSENGAVATALTADAAAGVFSVKVEKPELFAIGDLIEISNDLVDLVTGPYEDRATHRVHLRGELRKISKIDLDTFTVAWDDAASPEPQFHAALVHPQAVYYHAGIRRWSGLLAATPGDIALDNAVYIELGGANLLPADYWVFATRVADNSVERLIEAPPRGILHRYYPLAQIQSTVAAGVETVSVADERAHFHPLTELQAGEVAYDPSQFALDDTSWAGVENVQQAIDTLAAKDIGFDIRDHNKYLHGSGIVCGLQVVCNADRTAVTIRPGYALDCQGNPIRVDTAITFPVVTQANTAKLLDNTGGGDVCLTISLGDNSNAAIQIEAAPNLTFWQTVLQGTLLLDFYNNSIKPITDFLKTSFLPIPATTVPVPDSQKLLVSVLNLIAQLPFLLPLTAQYVFVSSTEDTLLRDFYNNLKALIASQTFCAMFDNVTPFPAYPYTVPPGIETAFGLFQFHKRIRVHPNNQYVYTCGTGSMIHVFDMSTNAQIQELAFPGGSTVEVQDVALSPAGDKLYAVGILNGQDSVFATATINLATGAHTWGPTTVVCDVLFVALGTTPTHAANLYAIGLAQGLYSFNPAAIPLVPAPAVKFNATGIMAISPNPDIAVVAEANGTPIGTVNASFNRYTQINLATMAAPTVFYTGAVGLDAENDVTFANQAVFATAQIVGSTVLRYNMNGGAPTSSVPLPDNTVTRLSPDPSGKWLLVTLSDQHRVVRLDMTVNPLAVDPKFRIPVQLYPYDIAINPVRGHIYALNFLSNTVSVITAATVLAAVPPAFTIEPPATLSAYRTTILQAFSDLLGKSLQYLKDAFCETFLVNCPDCKQDKVYLGCVEIQNSKVYKICNFSQRKYVKSVRLVEYWLSTVPVLPILKKLFSDFCCKVF